MVHTPHDSIQITTLYCPRKLPSTEILTGLIERHNKIIITGDFNSLNMAIRHILGQKTKQKKQQTKTKGRKPKNQK